MDLGDFLAQSQISVATFASSIGVSAAAAHRYVRKQRIPRPQVMRRIEAASGGRVCAADFYDRTVEVEAPAASSHEAA